MHYALWSSIVETNSTFDDDTHADNKEYANLENDLVRDFDTTIKFDSNIRASLKAIFKDHQYQDDIYKLIEKDWNPSTHDKDEEALGILKSTYKDKIETFYADDFALWTKTT